MKIVKSERFLKVQQYKTIVLNRTKMKTGKVKCLKTELDLGITLNGGQSFRWVLFMILNKFIICKWHNLQKYVNKFCACGK